MNVLGAELDDAGVLDLFAGSGALGLEALSRGARHATFVERDGRAIACLRGNIETLGAADQTTVINANVFSYLGGLAPNAFDIAFADPPYGSGLASRLVRHFLQAPFARILSVEHDPAEELALPQAAEERRYGGNR
jgi:16S rRNA (guanine966-N2)-methyltransferase